MLEYLRAEHFAGGWKAVLTYRKRGMILGPNCRNLPRN
jgi:hypothetical protein